MARSEGPISRSRRAVEPRHGTVCSAIASTTPSSSSSAYSPSRICEPQLVYSVALTNAGNLLPAARRGGPRHRCADAAVASHERPGRPRVFYERALGELGTTYLVKGDTDESDCRSSAVRSTVAQDGEPRRPMPRAGHRTSRWRTSDIGEWEQAAAIERRVSAPRRWRRISQATTRQTARRSPWPRPDGGGRPALSRDTRPREGPAVAAVVGV